MAGGSHSHGSTDHVSGVTTQICHVHSCGYLGDNPGLEGQSYDRCNQPDDTDGEPVPNVETETVTVVDPLTNVETVTETVTVVDPVTNVETVTVTVTVTDPVTNVETETETVTVTVVCTLWCYGASSRRHQLPRRFRELSRSYRPGGSVVWNDISRTPRQQPYSAFGGGMP